MRKAGTYASEQAKPVSRKGSNPSFSAFLFPGRLHNLIFLFYFGEVPKLAEGTPLERVQVVNSGARVQIPPSPLTKRTQKGPFFVRESRALKACCACRIFLSSHSESRKHRSQRSLNPSFSALKNRGSVRGFCLTSGEKASISISVAIPR